MRIAAASIGVAALLGIAPFSTPAIKRIETVNFANLQAAVGTPFVAPGQAKEYFIYGPWLDYADKVTFLGASQRIVEKKALFNSDGGLLRVMLAAPAGTSRGPRDMTIHIACPLIPFTDCQSKNITRSVMVLRVGTISQITPSGNVVVGQPTAFTISGTGLDVASIFEFRTMLTNTSMTSRNSSTFHFTGTPQGCGTNVVLLRDQAEGGDFYPYNGALSVSTTSTCGYSAPPTPLKACLNGTVYDPATKTCVKPE